MPTADKRACNTTRGYDEKGKRQGRTGGREGLNFLGMGQNTPGASDFPIADWLGETRMVEDEPESPPGGTQLKCRAGRARRDCGSKNNVPTTTFRIDMCRSVCIYQPSRCK